MDETARVPGRAWGAWDYATHSMPPASWFLW